MVNNEMDYLDLLQRFADTFQTLLDTIDKLESINNEMYRVDINNNVYLSKKQEKTYEENADLIRRFKTWIGSNTK